MEELTIGQRIAARRKELGLSQIDLGEKMGVSRQSVSKWESDAAIPEIDKLIGLSKLFQVSVGWILGLEGEDAPAENPEQTFTDREWEIIDRLSQPQVQMPRWLLPLAAVVTAVSVAAAALSGMALHASRNVDMSAISQAIAMLNISTESQLQDTRILRDYSYVAEPSQDLQHCTFRFTGQPAYYEEGSHGDLIVLRGSEIILEEPCEWNGIHYTAAFTVPVRDGYTASFCLTDKNGIVRTTAVPDSVLYQLVAAQSFGQVSMDYQNIRYDGSSIHLDEIRFRIDAPDMLRDTENIWESCCLLVLGDTQEVGRLDIMNRSEKSKEINFKENNVSFFTKEQTIETGDLSGCKRVELVLEIRLTTGLFVVKPVGTVHPAKIDHGA